MLAVAMCSESRSISLTCLCAWFAVPRAAATSAVPATPPAGKALGNETAITTRASRRGRRQPLCHTAVARSGPRRRSADARRPRVIAAGSPSGPAGEPPGPHSTMGTNSQTMTSGRSVSSELCWVPVSAGGDPGSGTLNAVPHQKISMVANPLAVPRADHNDYMQRAGMDLPGRGVG
jgi:hypothetical protein